MADAELATALGEPAWGEPATVDDIAYATEYLHHARDFALGVADDGRGFVYAIQ